MHRKKLYLVLCISLFLFSILNTNNIFNVSAQSTLQTFERNPIAYWNTSDEVTATYHNNNTISIKSSVISSSWYNYDWSKRRTIFLNGSVGAGVNYQVLINVTYDSDMQADFDDIRFCDSDNKTLLDYWLEVKLDSYWALFWVEVKDSLEDDEYIYMYYDNDSVSSISNGIDTFLMFDNFNDGVLDTTNWHEWGGAGGTPAESGGVQTLTAGSGWAFWGTYERWGDNHALGMSTKVNAESHYWVMGLDERTFDNSFVVAIDSATINNNGGVKYYTAGNNAGSIDNARSTLYTSYIKVEIQRTTDIEFYENHILVSTIAKNLDEDTGITMLFLNAHTTYQDWVYIRKCIDSEPYYNSTGSEIASSTFDYDEGYIDVSLLDGKDIKIKTMVEQNSFANNESVVFSIISELGELPNLIFTLNETYDYRIRIEFSLKKGLNLFKLILSDEYQVQIARYTESFIISKNLISFRMRFVNYTSTSKLNVFFMSGDLDFSADRKWERELISNAVSSTYHDSLQELTFHVEDTVGIQEQLKISYFRNFSDFQYIRTYLNSVFDIPAGSIDQSFIGFIEFVLFIDDIEIKLLYKVERTAGASDIVKAYITTPDDSLFDETLGFLTNGYDVAEDEYINRFAVWRTLTDEIGISASSNTEVLRYTSDTRIDIEEKTALVLKDVPSNWVGNITIEYTIYFKNLAPATIDIVQTLEDIEYDFNSDYGIAEPTFSSTWWGIFPFNIISDWLLGTFSADWDIPEYATDFFEMFTGVGEAVADFLSPYFGTIGEIMTNVWNTLVDIGSDIVGAVGLLFDNIAANILSWGQDVIEWFVDALIGFADLIADFLVWFVNGIGNLLGVTNLAGSIASVISNFASAISNFIGGIVLVFSVIIDGFAFVVGLITDYLPTALTFATMLIILHVGLSFASMDDKVIMNMVGVYAKIFEKVLGIFYSVANMVVQFIGGIIP